MKDDDPVLERWIPRGIEQFRSAAEQSRLAGDEQHQPIRAARLLGRRSKSRINDQIELRLQMFADELSVAGAENRRRLLPLQMRTCDVLIESIGEAEAMWHGGDVVRPTEDIRTERVSSVVLHTGLPDALNVEHRLSNVFDDRRAFIT